MGAGPKRMAPRPVPVGWLDEALTLGSFRADSKKQ